MDRAHQGSIGGRGVESEARAASVPGKSTQVDASAGGEAAPAQSAPAAPGADPKAPADPPNKSGITVKTLAVAAGNPSTARTSVGVGEQVTFSAAADGPWTAGGVAIGSGKEATWTAPDTAQSVEIAHGQKKLSMRVVAPTGIDFKKVGDFPVAPAGVGMTTMVTVLPTTVSFGAAKWAEKGGGPEDLDGYFKEAVKTTPLVHKPNATALDMGASNNAIEDHAWTSDNPKLKHPADNQVRHWGGRFAWNIPNVYKVGDGAEHEFMKVRQAFSMDENGRVTVTKGAATASAGGDGKLEGDAEKYATVAQAHAALNRQSSRTKAVMFVMQYHASNVAKDPVSTANLVKALTEENVQLYVYVQCVKSFSYVWSEKLSITASAAKSVTGKYDDMDSGKHREFKFDVKDVLDFATMTPANQIQFLATVDGKHEMTAKLGFPFTAIKDQPMAGSDGKYLITTFLQ